MIGIELKINAIAQLLLAQNEKQMEEARKRLWDLMEGEYIAECEGYVYEDPEALIRQVLLDLGAPDHLNGFAYAVRGIMLVISDYKMMGNLTLGLYPRLGAEFNTTAGGVERSIRNLIEITWQRGDQNAQMKYFGNTVPENSGKPTNGQFIARMANVVKQRMKTGK